MPEASSNAAQAGGNRGRRNRWRGRGGGRGRGRGGNSNQNARDAAQAQPAEAAQESPATHIGRAQATSAQPRGARSQRGRSGTQNAAINRRIPGTRREFGGHLTSVSDATPDSAANGLSGAAPEFVPGQSAIQRQTPEPSARPFAPRRRRMSKSTAPDLPTRIHEDIDNGNYECVICCNEVYRNSHIWTHEGGCWIVTHITCVKKWFRQGGVAREDGSGTSWRCPGCNIDMADPPGSYQCWCGKEPNPQLSSVPGIPPHSCGQTCSKSRGNCPHPCSIQCHAGPCPPCTFMAPPEPCFCGKKTSSKRCVDTDYDNGWSCGEVCGLDMGCGIHTCDRICHDSLCGSCEIPIPSTCYCGKIQKDTPCEIRSGLRKSFNYGQLGANPAPLDTDHLPESWFEGSFNCGNPCERTFDCGVHRCEKACHTQDEQPSHCPFSPDVVESCPCGKTPITKLLDHPRTSCKDEIPHCNKPCAKVLPCGHLCTKMCHTDSVPCGPCFQTVDIPCRCGRVISKSVCHQGREFEPPSCMRVCRAQLNCGRHECGERCCSGEKKAQDRRKTKNHNPNDIEPEHICIRVCDRLLKCGKHNCQATCHKGACGSCLEAIFEEISCACGRTVLQPPQPCGTKPPDCRFDCTRRMPCGHAFKHQCHTDDEPCPKCPFLVSKECLCGKQTKGNQPCWLTEVRCGLPCGKKLKCGAHTCRKTCHKPGECEDAGISGTNCTQQCGKMRKSCEHVCTDRCHAPSQCKEIQPCQSKTIITCPCQARKKETRCLASSLNPNPSRVTLECDDECLRLQRNRRLADALSINPTTHTDDHIPYSMETLKMYSQTPAFCQQYEREFRVFASDAGEKRIRFKPMPPHQRAFLHALAEDFGFDTQSEDPEPHRHVVVYKTPKFVSAPNKTLAQCVKIRAQTRITASSPESGQTNQEPFNALLLTGPRFGLTNDELEAALRPEFSKHSSAAVFTINFMPNDEIIVKVAPKTSTAWRTPAVEGMLTELKPVITRTVVNREKLVDCVVLVTVDNSLSIVRREQVSQGTWNTVVSKAAKRGGASAWYRSSASPTLSGVKGSSLGAAGNSSAIGGGVSRGFVALRLKKKEPVKEEPADSWEDAAENMNEVEEGGIQEQDLSLQEATEAV